MFTLKAVSCVASHRGAAYGVNESFYAFTVLHSLAYNTYLLMESMATMIISLIYGVNKMVVLTVTWQ